MEATITNNNIAATFQNSQAETAVEPTYKTRKDSIEFLSGVFYIFKKVFLLG